MKKCVIGNKSLILVLMFLVLGVFVGGGVEGRIGASCDSDSDCLDLYGCESCSSGECVLNSGSSCGPLGDGVCQESYGEGQCVGSMQIGEKTVDWEYGICLKEAAAPSTGKQYRDWHCRYEGGSSRRNRGICLGNYDFIYDENGEIDYRTWSISYTGYDQGYSVLYQTKCLKTLDSRDSLDKIYETNLAPCPQFDGQSGSVDFVNGEKIDFKEGYSYDESEVEFYNVSEKKCCGNFEEGFWTCTSLEGVDCCGLPVCGNGIVEEGEECDDGNAENGDGCSSDCGVEKNLCTYIGGRLISGGEEYEDGSTLYGAFGDENGPIGPLACMQVEKDTCSFFDDVDDGINVISGAVVGNEGTHYVGPESGEVEYSVVVDANSPEQAIKKAKGPTYVYLSSAEKGARASDFGYIDPETGTAFFTHTDYSSSRPVTQTKYYDVGVDGSSQEISRENYLKKEEEKERKISKSASSQDNLPVEVRSSPDINQWPIDLPEGEPKSENGLTDRKDSPLGAIRDERYLAPGQRAEKKIRERVNEMNDIEMVVRENSDVLDKQESERDEAINDIRNTLPSQSSDSEKGQAEVNRMNYILKRIRESSVSEEETSELYQELEEMGYELTADQKKHWEHVRIKVYAEMRREAIEEDATKRVISKLLRPEDELPGDGESSSEEEDNGDSGASSNHSDVVLHVLDLDCPPIESCKDLIESPDIVVEEREGEVVKETPCSEERSVCKEKRNAAGVTQTECVEEEKGCPPDLLCSEMDNGEKKALIYPIPAITPDDPLWEEYQKNIFVRTIFLEKVYGSNFMGRDEGISIEVDFQQNIQEGEQFEKTIITVIGPKNDRVIRESICHKSIPKTIHLEENINPAISSYRIVFFEGGFCQ